MYQEFPKCLTRGEEVRVVMDAEQEKAARGAGFVFHADKPVVADEAPKRRGKRADA